MLTTQKPRMTKNDRKMLRKYKWEAASELRKLFEANSYEFEFFNCKSTPHVRVEGVDYWPATTRFFDKDLKLWGIGLDNLKQHLVNKLEMKRLNVF